MLLRHHLLLPSRKFGVLPVRFKFSAWGSLYRNGQIYLEGVHLWNKTKLLHKKKSWKWAIIFIKRFKGKFKKYDSKVWFSRCRSRTEYSLECLGVCTTYDNASLKHFGLDFFLLLLKKIFFSPFAFTVRSSPQLEIFTLTLKTQ